MERRANCIQILTFLAVVLVVLADLSLIVGYIIKLLIKNDLETIRKDILTDHIFQIKRHQGNDLTRNKDIEKLSQLHVEKLILTGKYENSINTYEEKPLGKNLYKIKFNDKDKKGKWNKGFK